MFSFLRFPEFRRQNSFIWAISEFRALIKKLAESCKKEIEELKLTGKSWDALTENVIDKRNLIDLVGYLQVEKSENLSFF